MTTTMTSRELNQDLSKAKRLAKKETVIITDRGKPSLVLIAYKQYIKSSTKAVSLLDALSMKNSDETELETSRDKSPTREIQF